LVELRRLIFLTLLGPASAVAADPPSGDEAVPLTLDQVFGVHRRTTPHSLMIRRAPETKAAPRGRIEAWSTFQVFETRASEDPKCDGDWGRLGVEAWSCLAGTTAGEAPLVSVPTLVKFDPPRPEEEAEYRKTGTWPRSDDDLLPMPYIYGKRLGNRWQGRIYETVEAWVGGEAPIGQVESGESLHFYDLIQSPKGPALVRQGTQIVPLDDLHVYSASRFVGVDLSARVPPEGMVPGWVVHRSGAELRAEPDAGSASLWTVPRQTQLWLKADAEHPGWLAVVDPDGGHANGWLKQDSRVRMWAAGPAAPTDAGTWIDVDLSQQILGVLEGETLRYATLVSTGKSGHETPRGTYRLYDKMGWWDMTSLPDAIEPYHVEAVPWVMHFWPRYALHGAYWHDDFGGVRSHGCINLALADARYLFDLVDPALAPGWFVSQESPEAPGTIIRVRSGARLGEDRRSAL
jgi:hypothetical protein